MLNNGCISYILTGGVPEGAKDAAVQVLEMKRVDSKQQGNAPVRYRLIISDGQHYTQAMLATQLNGLVDDGSVRGRPLAPRTRRARAPPRRRAGPPPRPPPRRARRPSQRPAPAAARR